MSNRQLSGAAAACDLATTREQLRQQFIDANGYGSWRVEPLTADASFRRYFRLCGEKQQVLLMDAPPATEDIASYLKIDACLRGVQLCAPEILAVDEDNGFAVIEDFGVNTYTRLLNDGVAAEPLYRLAVTVLKTLHADLPTGTLSVPHYSEGFYEDEAALFMDWYWPAKTGALPSSEMRKQFMSLWESLLAGVSRQRECLVLRDYHVDNLMLLGDEGVEDYLAKERCGILDFQDALIGSPAYDLVSLFEDARRPVDQSMAKRLLEEYLSSFSDLDRNQFAYDYRVLGSHRHMKVIGIFVRLCVRDGKAHYLDYLPHVQRLLEHSLQHPALLPLKQWLDQHHPGSVAEPLDFDSQKLRNLLGLSKAA